MMLRVPAIAWAGLALATLFAVWIVYIGHPDFPLDDAYITLHNAQVLNGGSDPNYGVSAFYGATSSVHLALVALLARALGLAWAAAAAAWLGIALYFAGLIFIARRASLSSLETAALLVAGALAGMSAYHLLNGLETGLAMAAIVWAMALAARPPHASLPALLALMPFLRPELVFLGLPLFIRQISLRWQVKDWRGIAADVVISALVSAPWLAASWIETGHLLPPTAGAKRAFFAEAALPVSAKARSLFAGLGALLLQIGPLAFGALGLWRTKGGAAALLFMAAMLLLYGAMMPGGLRHNDSRYLYLFVPLLLVGMAAARGAAGSAKAGRWATWALCITAVFAVVTAPPHLARYAEQVSFTRVELQGAAEWVERQLPREARIAVLDAGYIAFATKRRLIDVVGLKTPSVVDIHGALTAPSGGERRGEAIARILRERRATHLVVGDEWDRIFALTQGLRSAGVDLHPMRTEGAYRVYGIGSSP